MTAKLRRLLLVSMVTGVVATGQSAAAMGQVQVRVGDPNRATYSELHEALKQGTPRADSVQAILHSKSPSRLWHMMRSALAGTGDWNAGLIALTRLAELRSRAYADSARRMQRRLERAEFPPFPANPGLKAEDVLPSLQAIVLERRRAVQGDSTVLADILRRIPSRDYDHGDAWILGRLGAGAVDTIARRFQTAETEEFRVRYLTLLSYFTDPKLIPLLTQVYVAPDSFGIPKRYAIRASDGLLWIGTAASLQALLDARAEAGRRGTYADSTLMRGGYDFLANDSSAVISRTGKWLTEWIPTLSSSAIDSAAAGRPVGVAAPGELLIELPLAGQRTFRMAAAEMLDMGAIVGHPGDLPKKGEERGERRNVGNDGM